MKNWFSRINVPTGVAVIAFIIVDKKFGLSDKIAARLPF